MTHAVGYDQGLHETSGLPAASHEHLVSLIRRALVSPGKDAFRAVCDEAIDLAVPPERLVVLVKRQWRAMPGSLRLSRVEAEHDLTRHVTGCIEEYFHPRRSARS